MPGLRSFIFSSNDGRDNVSVCRVKGLAGCFDSHPNLRQEEVYDTRWYESA